MKRSVIILAALAAALLIAAPGPAGAGEGHGWEGKRRGAYGHTGRGHRYKHGRGHRHGALESARAHAGPILVELRDPYLPPGVLYNVPGPPPVYAHSTVIRAKY